MFVFLAPVHESALFSYIEAVQLPSLSFGITLSERLVNAFTSAKNPDWDGLGARAVPEVVFEIAKEIIDKCVPGKPPIDYGPTPGGTLSYVWEDNRKNHVFLEIGPKKTVHLFYDTEQMGRWEGVYRADDKKIVGKFAEAVAELHIPSADTIVVSVAFQASNDSAITFANQTSTSSILVS